VFTSGTNSPMGFNSLAATRTRRLPRAAMGSVQHRLEISHGRWSTAGAIGSKPNEFHCRGPKAIIGHYNRGNLRHDDAPRSRNSFFQRFTAGVQVENYNIKTPNVEHLIDFILI
jgi:hypothetical protein